MKIAIYNQQSDVKILKKQVSALVSEVIRFEGKKCDEAAIHFVKTSEICRLHDEYFSDPTTTDCISFPMDSPDAEDYCFLGEVFVCPETAVNYSLKHDEDPYKETTLYIVHGILHLLGYRDMDPREKRKMRAAEKRHMTNLEVHGLILKRRARI